MKALIVDDNQGMRATLRELLTDVCTDIRESVDGEEAISTYAAFHPDVVLMDIRMPRLDGITATRQIVSMDSAARVIMVTDYDEQEYREDAMKAGALRFFNKEDLIAVRSCLEDLMKRNGNLH